MERQAKVLDPARAGPDAGASPSKGKVRKAGRAEAALRTELLKEMGAVRFKQMVLMTVPTLLLVKWLGMR